MSWINIRERAPENEQEVLTYNIAAKLAWNTDEYTIAFYYEAGTKVHDESDPKSFRSPLERIMAEIKDFIGRTIEVSGFYDYTTTANGLCKWVMFNPNMVSHWMPLPEPPNEGAKL